MNYYDIPDLENIYLEDSFVLGIKESADNVVFAMEFVLTKKHPEYSLPQKDEQYCYRKGSLSFNRCRKITWHNKSFEQFVDKNGEVDLGNIDSFTKNNSANVLEGDWGEIEILSDDCSVELD
jgi:hypothetical protein